MSADPLQPHSHDNNPAPPSAETHIVVTTATATHQLTVAQLHALPQTTVAYTYTTDHGVHGPYTLGGVTLHHLLVNQLECDLSHYESIEVISADGFGNRLAIAELNNDAAQTPILLCLTTDGHSLTLENGLIRLLVSSETDNALRQIKWVRHINLISKNSLD